MIGQFKIYRFLYLVGLFALAISFLGCSKTEEKPALSNQISQSMQKEWDASNTIAYNVDVNNYSDKMIPLNQILLKIQGDSMIMESLGDDPFLETQPLNLKDSGQYWAKIRMTSPNQTAAQVYFLRPGFDYREDDSVSVIVFKGKNQFIVKLKDPQTLTKIRFDPGMVPGTYVLEEFIVKKISDKGQ
jgi:hypothetical protein